MFGFGKDAKIKKLQSKHEKLFAEAYKLSKVNRQKSDAKVAEASRISEEIDRLMKVG